MTPARPDHIPNNLNLSTPTPITQDLIDQRLRTPSSSHPIQSGSTPAISDDLIDLILRTPSSSQPAQSGSTPSQSPFPPLRLLSDIGPQSYTESQFSSPFCPTIGTNSTTGSAAASSQLEHTRRSKKARRAKVDDAYHGYVSGVYRGNEPFSTFTPLVQYYYYLCLRGVTTALCRTHAIPPPIENTSKASATFLESMRSLIQKVNFFLYA